MIELAIAYDKLYSDMLLRSVIRKTESEPFSFRLVVVFVESVAIRRVLL